MKNVLDSVRRASARVAAAGLLIGACAYSQVSDAEETRALPAFVIDADHSDPSRMASHERWEAWYYASDDMASATVMSTSQDNIIQLVCYKNGLFMQIMPKRQLTSALESRRLAIGFDGKPLTDQPWKAAQVTKQDWDFDVGDGEPGFAEAITGFKQHREVTIAISEFGKEVMRQDFTLQDAERAIDYVLAACGKKS